ncbi:hypothetical protein SIAM614_31656 [Stappia aggregata IAM 12614]|nr:hypothetical protein SIAM614_31656 [Stappia aggregata IAM 12614] [Roseibium aggregatum IAM 12614]
MQLQENYTKPPSGWVGFLIGVAIFGISVLIAIWISYSLYDFDHKKAWPLFIAFPLGF